MAPFMTCVVGRSFDPFSFPTSHSATADKDALLYGWLEHGRTGVDMSRDWTASISEHYGLPLDMGWREERYGAEEEGL